MADRPNLVTLAKEARRRPDDALHRHGLDLTRHVPRAATAATCATADTPEQGASALASRHAPPKRRVRRGRRAAQRAFLLDLGAVLVVFARAHAHTDVGIELNWNDFRALS